MYHVRHSLCGHSGAIRKKSEVLAMDKVETEKVNNELPCDELTWSATEDVIKLDVDPATPGGDPNEFLYPDRMEEMKGSRDYNGVAADRARLKPPHEVGPCDVHCAKHLNLTIYFGPIPFLDNLVTLAEWPIRVLEVDECDCTDPTHHTLVIGREAEDVATAGFKLLTTCS